MALDGDLKLNYVAYMTALISSSHFHVWRSFLLIQVILLVACIVPMFVSSWLQDVVSWTISVNHMYYNNL
jgi:hypothetical protein